MQANVNTSSKKSDSAANTFQTIAFTDTHGATVSVPVDQAALYATIKADQLAALNSLIADATAGFDISLTENEIIAFSGLASELAHAASQVVGTVVAHAIIRQGGAQ